MDDKTYNFDPYATRGIEESDSQKASPSPRVLHDSDTAYATVGVAARCPHCHHPIELAPEAEFSTISCPACGDSFSLIPDSQSSTNGSVIKRMGHFDLLEQLGMGSFGSVWRARDTKLDRTVAVKIPRKEQLNPAETESFLREARAAARLRHPNIVSVHEVGRDGDSVYIVSDFVSGATLDNWLSGQQLTSREAANLCTKIADSLHYAHEQGIVHRDLKPANVIIDTTGGPHLLDFGLARREVGEVTVTMDGQIVGTPAYMSPEQAQGKSHTADRRSDVYSLGVMLFQLLTGELPFRGNLQMIVRQVIEEEPPSPRKLNSTIPKDMETITLKCLEKLPSRRYETAHELSEELRRYVAGEPILARPITRVDRIWRWCKRHPTVASLSASLVIGATIAFIVTTWQWLTITRTERERTTAQVNALMMSPPEAVPEILRDLRTFSSTIDPKLRELLEDKELGNERKARLRLALLPDDPTQTSDVLNDYFEMDVQELPLLRSELLAHGTPDREQVWRKFDDRGPSDERFRAAIFLAADPHTVPRQWGKDAPFVADQLLKSIVANVRNFDVLVKSLAPMRQELIPPLIAIFEDKKRPEQELNYAATILAEYADDHPDILVNLVLDSRPPQFVILMQSLRKNSSAAISQLASFLRQPPANPANSAIEDQRIKQFANASLALLHLGAADQVWPQIAAQKPAVCTSYLISWFKPTQTNPTLLLDVLKTNPGADLRRTAYLTLGAFPRDQVPHADQLAKELVGEYQSNPDRGVHSAIRWLLERWTITNEIDSVDTRVAGQKVEGNQQRHWYVNSQDQTMLIYGPTNFTMGSPSNESRRRDIESLHTVRIDRTFAVSACETTIKQFRLFREPRTQQAANDTCPVHYMSWSDAAAYCNWLSEKEGLGPDQWCYIENKANRDLMKSAPDCLNRHGYRLPTEAEWEYVCRAGTTSATFFGNSQELLTEYAWCPLNSPSDDKYPIGLKMPNPFGVFDIYGNALEWCHDYMAAYPNGGATHLDRETPATPDNRYRVLRGSAVGDPPPYRSAKRDGAPETEPGILAVGFRIAKTIKSSAEN